MLETQTALYRFNDTPWLSALDSVNNTDGELSYQWTEVSSIGATFETPNAGQTNFSVPESANEDLIIEVMITNESGYSVTKTATISYISSTGSVLSYDSPEGDYIGGGQKRIYTEEDGEFSFNYDETNSNYVGMAYNGNDWWYLDLAAPSDEAIGVGAYEEARRYPFQSPTAPGLSFSGSGRGCNQSIGRFEIFELVISENGNVESFAANFEQSCELTMPALKGQVRFNSQVSLNP
jgi:hypothetical protein